MSSPPNAPEPADGARRQRLFFALWPDAAVRRKLAGHAASAARHNGRAVAAYNLHLTLVYIGSTGPEMRDCMIKQADALQCSPFTLSLDRTGFWPRPRVVWLSASDPPDILNSLYDDLCARLAVCGYERESRPFRPHVTLVRKARHKPAQDVIEPVVWPVDRLCLVESVTDPAGVRYEVIEDWTLGAPPAESV